MKRSLIATALLVLISSSAEAHVCRSSDSRYQGEDFGWAGSLEITFDIDGTSLKNLDISVDYDHSAGVSSPDSVSIDEVASEKASAYAKSAAWKNASAFKYQLQNDAQYVLLLKIDGSQVAEEARVKGISGSEDIRLKCEE